MGTPINFNSRFNNHVNCVLASPRLLCKGMGLVEIIETDCIVTKSSDSFSNIQDVLTGSAGYEAVIL